MYFFLTFDGAPHAPYTNRILDVLKEHQVKATFFVEGHRIAGQEGLLRRILAEGHTIGNHTFSHRILTELSMEEAIEDVERCSEEIQRVTHMKPRAFRPPWGKIDVSVAEELIKKGYIPICWNVSVRDFLLDNNQEGVEELVCRLVQCNKDFVVPVLHDRVDIVPKALHEAIPKLKEKNFQFVTIEDFLP